MKKVFLIVAGALLFIGIVIGVYVFFSTDNTLVPVTTQNNNAPLFPVASKNTEPTSTDNSSTAINTPRNDTSVSALPGTIPRLTQISKGPVVPSILSLDMASTTKIATPYETVQYIDQQSGNIYQYNSFTGIKTRTSNKTIPGIQSASWLSDGSLAYVQYLPQVNGKNKNISTYALPKNGIGGFFLPQGLSEVLAKGTSSLLAVSSDKNGSMIKKASADASGVATAFQTPLSAIRVMLAGPKDYIVYTKPSATIGGYVFYVDSTTELLTPIVGPLNGLVALVNHAGTNVLVSYVNNSGYMRTELVSIATHSITKLPVSTIADKCVWSKDDISIYCGIPQNPKNVMYPDNWYQGVVSFTDQIWKINVTGKYAKFLLDFSKEKGSSLDAVALSIDSKQQLLSFVNKRTGALWAYRLQP